jgi:hypothetical protein
MTANNFPYKDLINEFYFKLIDITNTVVMEKLNYKLNPNSAAYDPRTETIRITRNDALRVKSDADELMNSLKAETVSNSTEQEVYDQLLAIITLYTQAVVIKDKLFRTDFFLKSDTTLKVNKELDALRKIAFNLQ